MLHRTKSAALATSLVMLALTACNIGKSPEPTPDVNALYTAAAETLVANYGDAQTQTALVAPPTASPTSLASPSPLPTFAIGGALTPFGTLSIGLTPLATAGAPAQFSYPVGCNDAQYIGGDPADGTIMDPQQNFKASWSMLNVGTCRWDEGYSFQYKSGDRLSGTNVRILFEEQFTEPGHSQAFVVHMQAPRLEGEYQGFWQMRDDTGAWFGSLVWVKIVVQEK